MHLRALQPVFTVNQTLGVFASGARISLPGILLISSCAAPPAAWRSLPAVLLTSDTGCEVDDQWALAHLLLAADEGEVDLFGVVTTHAPNLAAPAAETSAAAAREALRRVGPRLPPPVAAGSSLPLDAPDAPRTGPDAPRTGATAPRDGVGARFIIEASRCFGPSRRLTVLVIGAATDVASALLLDPTLAQRIEVVAMGFDGWPKGGDVWNVKNDPAAYRVLLGSSVPLTIGCAEVCRRHLVQDEEGVARLVSGGGDAGEYLAGEFRGWLSREEKLCREITGRRAWPLWDLITTAHLLGLTRVESRPRPALADDLAFDLASDLTAPAGSISWITAIEEGKLWKDLRDKLRRRAGRSPGPPPTPSPSAPPAATTGTSPASGPGPAADKS